MSAGGRPLGVLVVARWYPAFDDPGRGGFVADQVEAMHLTGRLAPAVLSFEDIRLSGSARDQATMTGAIGAFDELGRSDAVGAWSAAGSNGPPGIPVRRARVPHLSAGIRRADDDGRLHATAALADDIAPVRVDVVHAHGGYPDGVAAAAIAAKLGRPYVITEHASYVYEQLADPTVRTAYLRAALGAARVIAVSQTQAARLTAVAPELAGRLTIVPNAIAVERIRLADPTARRPDELLFIGGRRASKGISVLLHAFARVRATLPTTTLRLIGITPGGDDPWRALAADLGIAEAVSFEGPVDRAGVMAALARATLFVHPSPVETFGVVAAEALATGLPVVAADSGGVTEILDPDPDRFGAIVPRDDPAAFAAAIDRTLGRLAEFDRHAMRARIVERYAAAAVASRLADLLSDVVAEAGGPLGSETPEGTTSARSTAVALDPGRPVIVVGLDRARAAARLEALPVAVRRSIQLVTMSGDTTIPPDLAGLHEPDIEGDIRRETTRLRRSPVRRLWYRVVDRDDDARRARRGAARIRAATAALEAVAAGSGIRPLIVPIDGGDHLVALAAVRAGAGDASPGGLRWLADVAASGPA